MFIKKLELQGFKSFPDRTGLVFHPGITAIVGPNGTGKSNIVDAFLWVIGGSRPKSMRGERVEDIIFNGNSRQPALGMADVFLTLGNEEEEMTISHRVFRTSESEYRLDGKAVRLRDVQETLWKKGVAEKEYFVIEQGAVGSFVTSKPTEKRLLLEEAAGTAFYKDKKKQAQNKLEISEQNLIRLEDIISEVEKAKNSLQRQAQAANRYRKLRERIRELSALHYQRKLRQLERRQEEVLRHYNDCLDRERMVISRLKSEEKELTQKRKELWDLERSLKETREHLFSLRAQVTRLETEIDKATKRIEHLHDKRKEADQDTAELGHELALLEKEQAQAEDNLRALEQDFAAKQDEVSRAEQKSQAAREKMVDWSKQLEKTRDAYLAKISELTEVKNESARAEKELELVIRQEERLNGQALDQQLALQQKEELLRQMSDCLAQSQLEKEEKEKSVAQQRIMLEELSASLEKVRKELASLKEKRGEDNYHLQALKKVREALAQPEQADFVPGSLGVLSDLLEASPEDAPLVDLFWKEEVKSVLIPVSYFLRNLLEKKLRGNFLLIGPKSRDFSAADVLGDPRVLGFLKSKLRPTDPLRDLLPHLQEAVIVANVKDAIELWLRHPALNFVTPAGDLLLASGLLKLGQNEEGIIALNQEVKKLEERVSARDLEIQPVASRFEDRTQEIEKATQELQREDELFRQIQKTIGDLEKEREFTLAEKEKIAGTHAILNQEVLTLRAERQSLAGKTEAFLERIKILSEEERALKEASETLERELALYQQNDQEEGRLFFELKGNRDLVQERMQNTGNQFRRLTLGKESTRLKIEALKDEIHAGEAAELTLREHIQELEDRARKSAEEKNAGETGLNEKELLFQKTQGEQEALEQALKNSREEEERMKEDRVKWEISKAELERDLINLEETCWQDLKKTLHEVKIERFEETLADDEIEVQLNEDNETLQKYKAVNLMAEEEFTAQKLRYDFLVQQKKDLRESIDSTQEAIKRIDEESKAQFLTALSEVNKNFQEVFALLFKGGVAEVKLLDAENPLESGVDIIAQPPGKKVQNLVLLSGGEKSLTSLAFLFALFRYKPTPFCFLDEVDAALDEVNLARFLDLMKNIKSQTQFVIITHNYKTMEVADYIYGTTMVEPNVTKIYSMKFEKKEEPPTLDHS